jgi:hypothetical protein
LLPVDVMCVIVIELAALCYNIVSIVALPTHQHMALPVRDHIA